MDLRNDAEKASRLGSVSNVYEEETTVEEGPLYAFLPILPEEPTILGQQPPDSETVSLQSLSVKLFRPILHEEPGTLEPVLPT